MFNPAKLLIDACVRHLQQAYQCTYGQLEPLYPGLLGWVGCMALETIANSDALYHNVEHTILATLVGQDILKGKHHCDEEVSPRDWLHMIVSLLCHDIGYVRGVCRHDRNGSYSTGIDGETVTLPRGSTDASLTPFHVERSKRFVRERFGTHEIIDAEVLAANIERTRFPVPDESAYEATSDYPGLVRAADLIGQLADPRRMRKFPALFAEFEETGVNAKLGYANPDDLRDDNATFYWKAVYPYIRDSLQYLSITQEGKQWITNLYAHVFVVEHPASEDGKPHPHISLPTH